MSHFAKVDENNIVIQVIVAEQEYIDTLPDSEKEKYIQTSYNTHGGKHYKPSSVGEGDNVICENDSDSVGERILLENGSYLWNEEYTPSRDEDDGIPLRKNFAGRGFTYDSGRDAFIPPKPYSSWTLNEETCLWEAPIPEPDPKGGHVWNEITKSWDELIV